jgi:hypothetical protein
MYSYVMSCRNAILTQDKIVLIRIANHPRASSIYDSVFCDDKYEFMGEELLIGNNAKIRLFFNHIADMMFIKFNNPVHDMKFNLSFNKKVMLNYDIIHSEENMYFWIKFHFPIDFSLINNVTINLTLPDNDNQLLCYVSIEKMLIKQ